MAKLSTDRQVSSAPTGRYGITGPRGLMLAVSKAKADAEPARSWLMRYQLYHSRHDLGLGSYPDVTLSKARERGWEVRRLLAEGIDPLQQRRQAKTLSFKAAAEALIESKQSGWRNAKHAAQWPATLATYVYPKIGTLDVKVVDTQAIVEVLRPIWSIKPETASRVRQRMEAVLDYATALGVRTGDNPARWKGHLDNLLAKPSSVRQVEHHAALDWREAPAFMNQLAAREGLAARALAFVILTAARSGEVRGMTWAEVDDGASVWTVPASRIKAKREHRVPLTPVARTLLGDRGEASTLVFPSPADPARPLSDMTLTAVLKRMKRDDITVHGARSTFRDWAGETTSHPREVIEAALAHQLKDKAEAAYARGDLFTKRRKLMDDWADFLAKLRSRRT